MWVHSRLRRWTLWAGLWWLWRQQVSERWSVHWRYQRIHLRLYSGIQVRYTCQANCHILITSKYYSLNQQYLWFYCEVHVKFVALLTLSHAHLKHFPDFFQTSVSIFPWPLSVMWRKVGFSLFVFAKNTILLNVYLFVMCGVEGAPPCVHHQLSIYLLPEFDHFEKQK